MKHFQKKHKKRKHQNGISTKNQTFFQRKCFTCKKHKKKNTKIKNSFQTTNQHTSSKRKRKNKTKQQQNQNAKTTNNTSNTIFKNRSKNQKTNSFFQPLPPINHVSNFSIFSKTVFKQIQNKFRNISKTNQTPLQLQSLFTKSGGSSLWGWPAHMNPKPHGLGLSSTWCGSKRPSCACPAGLVCERHASGTARRRLDLVSVKISQGFEGAPKS